MAEKTRGKSSTDRKPRSSAQERGSKAEKMRGRARTTTSSRTRKG